MVHRWCNFPVTTMNGATSTNTLAVTEFTQDGAGRWNTDLNGVTFSYLQSINCHTVSGTNATLLSSSGNYTIMGKIPSYSTKTTYFSIEMAVKLANGRTVRVKPYAGTVSMIVNGYAFSITLSSSNWTTYTSTTDSTRQVYRTTVGAKQVGYCSGYFMAPGGYINITTTDTTVYGSSGHSTEGTYVGKYTLNTSTTSNGVTFKTELFSDISNGRVGFKILSGF